jgi:GxxExxY protein
VFEPNESLDELTGEVIGAAIAVHKELGPGFNEAIYEHALCIELTERDIAFVTQAPILIKYRGQEVGVGRLDLLVENQLVIELKTVEALLPVHLAQVTGYLKATGLPLGLLINFNVAVLKQGIRRVVLSASSRSSLRLRDESL